jgi:hypothetical protein
MQDSESKRKTLWEKMTKNLSQLLGHLQTNDVLKEKIVQEFEYLPSDELRERYYSELQRTILGREKNPVQTLTKVKGTLFEISRINLVNRQNLETLLEGFDAESPGGIVVDEYLGFKDAPSEFTASEDILTTLPESVRQKFERHYSYSTDSQEWVLNEGIGLTKVRSLFQHPSLSPFLEEMYLAGPTEKKKKSPISLDVPIIREKPYVYDAKSYPRRIYGQSPNQINQLLKYQKGIELGLIDGATIEIDGRLDPGFLKWAAGDYVSSFGEIPDIEILYSLPLPSGKEYRFVLKSSRGQGLQFENENHLSPQDTRICKGVQKAILDGSIFGIIADLDPSDFAGIESNHIKDPSKISDIGEYERYEEFRLQSIWTKLTVTHDQYIINKSNKLTACSPLANPDNVERIIRNYQAYLQQNPTVAKIKQAYILRDEQVSDAVAKAMSLIQMIQEFESGRQRSDTVWSSARHRTKLGYVGLQEGVALDLEHVIVDAIMETNRAGGQKGRSYTDISRFKTAADLQNHLSTIKSKRYIEVKIYDPETGQTSTIKPTKGGEKAVYEVERGILKENLQRLEEAVREKNPLGYKKRIQYYQSEIQKLEAEKTEKLTTATQEANKSKDFSTLKELSEEYNSRIFGLKRELKEVYSEVIGQNPSDDLGIRITGIIDQEIVKFIYIVTADGTVVVDDEVVRGEISGRASHSELAQGRNVYGAGELIYSKHNNNFDSFSEWNEWQAQRVNDLPWQLTEINNGSGHYRPSPETLVYVEQILGHDYKLDVSKAELVNALVRGSNLREEDIF